MLQDDGVLRGLGHPLVREAADPAPGAHEPAYGLRCRVMSACMQALVTRKQPDAWSARQGHALMREDSCLAPAAQSGSARSARLLPCRPVLTPAGSPVVVCQDQDVVPASMDVPVAVLHLDVFYHLRRQLPGCRRQHA